MRSENEINSMWLWGGNTEGRETHVHSDLK